MSIPTLTDMEGKPIEPQRRKRRSSALTVVTTSEIQTHRDCPQKHDFQYRQRLRPLTTGKALAVGHVFHHGMSKGLIAGWVGVDGLTTDQRLTRQIEASIADVDAQLFEWCKEQVQHSHSARYDEIQEFADTSGIMIKFMLENYFRTMRRDLEQLVLVDTEHPFSVRVRDVLGRRLPIVFQGVRDALFYDPTYNALELHEHKTVSNLPEDIGRRAEMDPQTSGYLYALIEDRAGGGLKFPDGKPVPGDAVLGRVAYNAVRKRAPATPKVNQDGSVSVAAIDTTVEIYMAALDEQQKVRRIPVSDKQLELMHKLKTRGNTYCGRFEYQKTKAEIERWRSDTVVDASRIRLAATSPAARTRNPGHCNMPWSLPCTYRAVCLDDTPETRAMFRVVDDAHPEVREAEAAETAA